MTTTDEQLVRDLGTPDGDRAARELYRAYGPELFGFAVQRLGDRGAAEEVVQDVFARAWRAAGGYERSRGSVRTWLYGIARNAIVDFERRRGRRPRLSAVDPPEAVSGDDPIERALLRWQIQLAFAGLTPDHREVVELAHLHGWRLHEIAAHKGLALGTIKSRLYYGLKNLRLALEELGVTP